MLFHSTFTQEEIEKYLIACPSSTKCPSTIAVKRAHDKVVHQMPLAEFEHYFKITYRPYLTFDNQKMFQWMLTQCPYLLRFPQIAEENHALFKRYQQAIEAAELAPMSIHWINPIKGYGAFAEKALDKGEFVGEYTGLIRPLSRLKKRTNVYCFHYPTRLWSFQYIAIDAEKLGNLTRFFNHNDEPNLEPHCLVDRNLLHTVFLAKRAITPGEELTFNYDPDCYLKH